MHTVTNELHVRNNKYYDLTVHKPVLPELIRTVFSFSPGKILDVTAGAGGHSRILLELGHTVTALDRDISAVQRLKRTFSKELSDSRIIIHHQDFHKIFELGKFDGIIADLGLSSDQLADEKRGFSFESEGPLDMRMDTAIELSAADIVEKSSAVELALIIKKYGEEQEAFRIAKFVAGKRFKSAKEFADAVSSVKKLRKKRIHPATQTFQALRIYVNDELNQLEKLLYSIPEIINKNGVFAVIAFHSLEDRIVKKFIKKWSGECICPPKLPVCGCNAKEIAVPLWNGTKKADNTECSNNPRARSARMRAVRFKGVESPLSL